MRSASSRPHASGRLSARRRPAPLRARRYSLEAARGPGPPMLGPPSPGPSPSTGEPSADSGLHDDKRAIFIASALAEKAADHLHGLQPRPFDA